MKSSLLRCLFAFAVVFVLSGEGVLGQSNAQPTSAKIAVIYSDAFADEKVGITRFLAIKKTLELEFELVRKDLLKLKTQVDGLEKELRDGAKVPDINSAANKARQLERLKRESDSEAMRQILPLKSGMPSLPNRSPKTCQRRLQNLQRRTGSLF